MFAATPYSSVRWSAVSTMQFEDGAGLRIDERKDAATPYLSERWSTHWVAAALLARPAKQSWREFPGQARVIQHAGAPICLPGLSVV